MRKDEFLFAAVLVYNISCNDSTTCQALRKVRNVSVQVLVYDNSTSDFGNREYCKAHGWTYLGDNGNVGISKAYNGCIRELKKHGQNGFLCLFDDDTMIDNDYFAILQNEASNSKSSIFVPLVYSGGKLLSPCKITKYHRATRFRNEAELYAYKGSKLSAINSGMVVALSLFDDYQYDERIFLDGVDHTFIQDMAMRGNKLHILPYRCNHEFSGDSKPPLQWALARFQVFSMDYSYILKYRHLAYWYLVGKRALHLIMQYRSLSFLRIPFIK